MTKQPASYSDDHQKQSLNRFLGKLIEQYGTEVEAAQFIQANLHDPSIREKRINQCMEKNDYEQVIQLALDGEKMDREYRGRVKKWQEKRYAAYKALAWKDEQRSLAKMLFMDGDFGYYKDLKALADNPTNFYLRLKQELKEQPGGQALYLFERLIEEAQDYAELIEFVQKHPEYIEEHAIALYPVYPQMVQEIYKDEIYLEARKASNRSAYRVVCFMIGRYGEAVGEKAVQEIVDELKVTYKRKRAFLDELGKV